MTDSPNIVLVSWDSVRADHLSCYGYGRETAPFLSALADDGLVVEDVQVSGVGTPTSFTGAFTGAHATGIQTRVDPDHWAAANADRTLLSERLSDLGYHTGGFHFNALMSRHFGWNRGWDTYVDHLWTDGPAVDRDWASVAFDVLSRLRLANAAVHGKKILCRDPPTRWTAMWDDIATFVEETPEPFFLWVLLTDTHHPYYPPAEHHEWPQPGLAGSYAWNYVARRWPSLAGHRHRGLVNGYDNAIRYADQFLECLVDKLTTEGYGDAPLVVHSDHGDELGEHAPRPYGHQPLMYDTVTCVPLVFANVGHEGRLAGPNTLLDLPSTILDIAGCDDRPADRPSVLDAPDHDSVVVQNRVADRAWMAAVVGPEWKVLAHPDSDSEAYHRPTDPYEQDDRWGDGDHPSGLEATLEARLSALSDLRFGEPGPRRAADTDVKHRLADLGYLQ